MQINVNRRIDHDEHRPHRDAEAPATNFEALNDFRLTAMRLYRRGYALRQLPRSHCVISDGARPNRTPSTPASAVHPGNEAWPAPRYRSQ